MLYGGIEAGGTKFVCAVGTGPDDLRNVTRFPTTTPEETLGRTIAYFKEQMAVERLGGIGIASFGPVDPDPASPKFGFITSTPKPGWANTDFAGPIRRELGVPIGFDTDTNAAGLGEYVWGAAKELDTFAYITIGTGIGVGGLVNGKFMHGLIHPETGHMLIPHDTFKDPFAGSCPFHGDCFEGLASGPAIGRRWGQPADTLPDNHPAWALEARYIALALHNMICTLSPKRIVVGGGVMERPHLLPIVREQVQKLLNGYVQSPAILKEIDQYIVAPALGRQAGVLGAIALAQQQQQ